MAGTISFHFEDISIEIQKPRITRQWIKNVAKGLDYEIEAINYIFCTDEYLYKLNQSYLKHKTYTDILTFDYSAGKSLLGDVYISVERVQDNSSKLRVPFQEELRRVMIHGILHMMGFKDKTGPQKAIMRKKEEACLSLFPD